MATIYDITGDRFFTPLSSKNKKIYMDTILYLHGLINELFDEGENDKNKVINALSEHLNDLVTIRIYEDDSDEEIDSSMDNYSKATLIVNKLEEYGWLVEESVGDGKKAIDFNSHSYSFISLIDDLMSTRRPQYTSYIRIINNTIYKFEYKSTDDLHIIDDALKNFVVALRGLRSSLQGYYKNITKNKETIDLETLLEEFTGEYKEYFFDSAYLNLKIRDNVDAEIPKIEKQLNTIFNDFLNMEKLVNARINDKDYPDYDSAYKYVSETKKRIMSNIRTIPSLIEMIDSKNEKYVTRTVSVIIHLISRGEDIQGILNRLIDYVKEHDIDENYISLFEMKHYDFNAFAVPRKANIKPIPEMIEMTLEVSEEAKAKSLAMLQEDIRYNIHAVNHFVSEFLEGQNQRKISELTIKSNYEFIMMISIMMYSKLIKASYRIDPLDERIQKEGVSFNDFIVKRKGGDKL